ncbi:hypothetical protein [Haematobacter missouriensis]|uniref:hypothetical protein n=1 Tax=Haematobacter missouriensis TaxID=366616 RepID=UPI00117B984B|nr:hypothetical protein [Haematobacter missouriensis]
MDFLPENFNGRAKESRFTNAVKDRIDKLDIAPKGENERGIIQRAITNAMGGNWNLLALVPGRPLFTELGTGHPWHPFRREIPAAEGGDGRGSQRLARGSG